jgi:hypothetical protein
VGGAGFHAGGSGEDFGAYLSDYGEVGGSLERGIGVAGEGDGVGAALASSFDGGYGERGASTRCYAEDYVVFRGLAAGHFFAAGLGVVFADFGGGG